MDNYLDFDVLMMEVNSLIISMQSLFMDLYILSSM